MPKLLIRNSSIGYVKSIIFDKDGTLANSEEYLIELAKKRIEFTEKKFVDLKINKLKILLLRKILFTLYGLKNHYLASNAIMAIASRDQNIISTATIFTLFGFKWSESLLISHHIFDEVDIFLSNQKESINKLKPLVSGAKDLLVSLKNEGICLALMTNDTKRGVEEFIAKNKLEGLFDYLWSSENKPSKPNPLAVIELCKRMNSNPSECALISDADADLRMAKEADISIRIGFTGGWIKAPSLNEKQFLLTKLNELNIQRNA